MVSVGFKRIHVISLSLHLVKVLASRKPKKDRVMLLCYQKTQIVMDKLYFAKLLKRELSRMKIVFFPNERTIFQGYDNQFSETFGLIRSIILNFNFVCQ